MTTKKTVVIPASSDDFVPDGYYLNDPEAVEAVEAEVVQDSNLAMYENDPYMSDEYNDPNAQYPRIQTLRGEGAQKACWFIPSRELDRAGWLDPNPTLTDYHFQGGDVEAGLVIYEPRMLVAIRSTRQVFDRAESTKQKKMVFCGEAAENQELLEQKENYGAAQYFRVYLLSSDNAPLAEMPFEYRAKGATLATFIQQWEQSCDDITRFHCQAARRPFAKKNAAYKALCVFEPIVEKKKVDTEAVAVMAAKITGYKQVGLDNWAFNFLGRQQNADWFADVMDVRPLSTNTVGVLAGVGGNDGERLSLLGS
jgi:Family of unknown function (DUF5895)